MPLPIYFIIASRRIVTRQEMCIADEVEHIRACAAAGESHIVMLGSPVFFSTETGDAWLLDLHDRLAACVMSDGQPLAVAITETETNFSIAWSGHYAVRGSAFVITEASGRITAYGDYPVQAIARASRSAL